MGQRCLYPQPQWKYNESSTQPLRLQFTIAGPDPPSIPAHPGTLDTIHLQYTRTHQGVLYSPSGMPSTSSSSLRQLSASISAYLTRSCAQSWLNRDMWYCVDWNVTSSSRRHFLTKMERLCWLTIDSLSYEVDRQYL